VLVESLDYKSDSCFAFHFTNFFLKASF